MKILNFFLLLPLIVCCFNPKISAQQSDTSSYFPLGLWGIWIDQDKPPFSRDLNTTEWNKERTNWTNIKGNYMVYWIPSWVEDDVMDYANSNNYKIDIGNQNYYYPSGSLNSNSLIWWLYNSGHDSATADGIIEDLRDHFGSNSGFYSYSFGQETPVSTPSLWPYVEFLSRRIHALDPTHKSYMVSGGAPSQDFINATPHLDILQMDCYFFYSDVPQTYNAQQNALDNFLTHYNNTMNRLKGKQTEWQAVIQSQHEFRGSCTDLRRPNYYELRAQAYLALSRGSRGITAFVYGSWPSPGGSSSMITTSLNTYARTEILRGGSTESCDYYYAGLVDPDRDAYTALTDPDGIAAFDNLKNLYLELKPLGSVIRKLKVYNSFPNTSIPPNNSAGIYSVSGDKIELGTFKRMDEGIDSTNYFMVVNRVCNNSDGSVSSPQSISIVLNGYQSIIDKSNGQTISGSYNTSNNRTTFTVSLDPGKGKLFAFNRTIQLANLNKSLYYGATANNNAHIVERGHTANVLHEVFHSGGEIFYRRSTDNGSTWNITQRLSDGTGVSERPSMSAGYHNTSPNLDILRVVWQQKLDNYHYKLWYVYSDNGGISWSSPQVISGCSSVTVSYNQSNQGYGPGSTPVVSAFVEIYNENTSSFAVIYAASNGLHYRLAYENYHSWVIPQNDIIPGTLNNGNVWYPSLGTYSGKEYQLYLIYDDRFNHVYSNFLQYPTPSWSSQTIVETGGVYNRYSSIAVDYAGSTLVAWCGQVNGSSTYRIRFRQGFSNGTWSNWYKEFSVDNVNSFCPALTYYNKGGSYPYGIDILWYTSTNQIRQKKYYGTGDIWIPSSDNASNLIASNALFANITHETSSSGTPRQFWTDQSTAPTYSISFNTLNLPKTSIASSNEKISRAAVVADDNTNSSLQIEVGQPVINFKDGTTSNLPFKIYDQEKEDSLTLSNLFSYLQTDVSLIPTNASSISYPISLQTTQPPDTLAGGSVVSSRGTPFNTISISVSGREAKSDLKLFSKDNPLLDSRDGKFEYSNVINLDLSSALGKNIIITPQIKVQGVFNEKNLRFGLSDIVYANNSSAEKNPLVKNYVSDLPTEYNLSQNYPNPFNPSTVISYSIPADGFVSLKIYDILGREVGNLVNEEKLAGTYAVNFDASKLPSGVYIYSLKANDYIKIRKMTLVK